MKQCIRWTVAAILLCNLFACDDEDNALSGSLVDSHKIEFDSIRIRQYTSELSIEYVQDTEAGEKISLRVTLEGNAFVKGQKYDLKNGGTVSRGEGYPPLPTLESGELEFSTYGATANSNIEGDFSGLFVTADQSKLSLRGNFTAKLEVVP